MSYQTVVLNLKEEIEIVEILAYDLQGMGGGLHLNLTFINYS